MAFTIATAEDEYLSLWWDRLSAAQRAQWLREHKCREPNQPTWNWNKPLVYLNKMQRQQLRLLRSLGIGSPFGPNDVIAALICNVGVSKKALDTEWHVVGES